MKLTIELICDATDAQAGRFVRVVEKPGCMSQGATIAEALAMIAETIHAWDGAADDDMHVDACDDDCDLYRELDASIRRATASGSWREWD